MLGLLRIALLVATLFLLLGVVMAVGSGTTGAAEKVVLIAIGVGIIALLPRIRRIGPPRNLDQNLTAAGRSSSS